MAMTARPALKISMRVMISSLRVKVSHRACKVNPIAALLRPLYARSMTDRHDSEQAARRELDRLRQEGDALGGIFSRWFAPHAIDTGDRIELWGARIGRGLSAVAVIAICLYLVWVYVR
jgi:hypothetical protein